MLILIHLTKMGREDYQKSKKFKALLNISEISNKIKELAENDRISFKKHAVLRMFQRNIFVDEVREALINGEIIEDYPKDRALPSYLVLGYIEKLRPLHIVVAYDPNESILWVITVYEPNPKEWEEGFRKRRR